eukprot:TRINITY_DN811_c0_g1_i1.p1 TRINITY_DN811_c0_g1~~TRINITY_DN811_c0_g1_i1.p1  ORF type:complete len:948 (-),score=149.11 TRINITY_DN811_c0_g1_i1:5471-8314(-)
MCLAKNAEENVSSIVAQAFNTAQRTAAAHPRATSLLLRAYHLNPDAFLDSFTFSLNRLLLVYSRDPPVERLVHFVSRFAAGNTNQTANLCSLLLTYLSHHSSATSRAVRFRSVQIIAAILHELPEDAVISEDIWETLNNSLINRSQDRLPRVRAAAAGALCRIQTTGNPDDDVFCARLVEMLSLDNSTAVRKAALNAVALTEYTIPYVVERTRDVNDDVRATVYEILSRKLHPSSLSTLDRVQVLKSGLQDRSESVRKVCERSLLLQGWLDGACQGNIFELIDLLGAHEFEDEVLQALRFVFVSERCQPLVEAIQIDVNNMSGPDVLVLRAMSHTQNGQSSLQKFLPTTSVYAQVLHYYAVDKFAIRHLLDLCRAVDMSDEVGRTNLQAVLRSEFLLNEETDEDVIPSAIRALRRVLLDVDDTLRIVMEILRNDLLSHSEPKSETESAEGDIEEWKCMRALNICLEVLRITPQQKTNSAPSITLCLSILQLAALPHLMSEDGNKRKSAFECVALYCLLDKSGDEARSKLPLFIQACENDLPTIQECAMQALVDFLTIFDFADDAESIYALTPRKASDAKRRAATMSSLLGDVIGILSEGLTSAEEKIRTIAAQGTSRLLFLRRVSPTAKLLSRMLIVYHNPVTEDDHLLRQSLSLFFPSFCMASAINRIVLEDAFKPTCEVLLSAPESSPLATVDVVQVAQFILHLTNPAVASKGEQIESIGRPADLVHERLAEVVLNELIDAGENGDEEVCRIFARILSSFRLQGKQENHEYLIIIKRLSKQALAESDDRRVKNLIRKFQDRVESAVQISGELVHRNEKLDNLNGVSCDAQVTSYSETSMTSGKIENSEVSEEISKQGRIASSRRALQKHSVSEMKKAKNNADIKPKKKSPVHVTDERDYIIDDRENSNDPNFVIDVGTDSSAHPISTRKYPRRTRKKIIDFIEID